MEELYIHLKEPNIYEHSCLYLVSLSLSLSLSLSVPGAIGLVVLCGELLQVEAEVLLDRGATAHRLCADDWFSAKTFPLTPPAPCNRRYRQVAHAPQWSSR